MLKKSWEKTISNFYISSQLYTVLLIHAGKMKKIKWNFVEKNLQYYLADVFDVMTFENITNPSPIIISPSCRSVPHHYHYFWFYTFPTSSFVVVVLLRYLFVWYFKIQNIVGWRGFSYRVCVCMGGSIILFNWKGSTGFNFGSHHYSGRDSLRPTTRQWWIIKFLMWHTFKC